MRLEILIVTAAAVVFSIGFIVGASWNGMFAKKPQTAMP
jgi:hypothetical protein